MPYLYDTSLSLSLLYPTQHTQTNKHTQNRSNAVAQKLRNLQSQDLPRIRKQIQNGNLEEFAGEKEVQLNRNYVPISNLFTPDNRPDDVVSQFDEIEPPPNLIALDRFTEDGAPSQLTKFSDPDFFFREWAKAEEARNAREQEMKKMRKRKRKQRKMNEKARQAKQQAYGQMSTPVTSSKKTISSSRSTRGDAPSRPQPISPVRRPAPRKPAPRPQISEQESEYDTKPTTRRAPPKPSGSRRAPPKPSGSRRPPPRPSRRENDTGMSSPQISAQSSDEEMMSSPDVHEPPPRNDSGPRRPPPTRRAPPARRPAPKREVTPPPTPEPTIPDGMCYAKDHPQYAKHFRNLEKKLLPIPAIKRAMAQNGLDPNVLDDPMAVIPDGEVQVRRKAAGGMRAALMVGCYSLSLFRFVQHLTRTAKHRHKWENSPRHHPNKRVRHVRR